jgi:hypothetical protein
MTRVVLAFFLSSLTVVAQTSRNEATGVMTKQATCGPVDIQARMVDPSLDRPQPAQKVHITLNNLKSTSIILERITLHFDGETPTSGAPLEVEARAEVGPRQHAFLGEETSTPEAVRSVELNYVKYSDGSSWQPKGGDSCAVVPAPIKGG